MAPISGSEGSGWLETEPRHGNDSDGCETNNIASFTVGPGIAKVTCSMHEHTGNYEGEHRCFKVDLMMEEVILWKVGWRISYDPHEEISIEDGIVVYEEEEGGASAALSLLEASKIQRWITPACLPDEVGEDSQMLDELGNPSEQQPLRDIPPDHHEWPVATTDDNAKKALLRRFLADVTATVLDKMTKAALDKAWMHRVDMKEGETSMLQIARWILDGCKPRAWRNANAWFNKRA